MHIKACNNFSYLGSTINTKSTCEEEIDKRGAMGRGSQDY